MKIPKKVIEMYTKVGDYYISNLIISKEKRPIGKYGRLRKTYLQEHRSIIYSDMVLSDKLWHHLADVEEKAQLRLEVIIQQMKEVERVTEELNAKEQMEWVRRINYIMQSAEEFVYQ